MRKAVIIPQQLTRLKRPHGKTGRKLSYSVKLRRSDSTEKEKTMNSKIDFVLLITNSADNDYAAERTANAGRSVIHHKLCYTPVYKDFDELRKIQLKLKDHISFSGKKICAIIDISEWAGHEDEEYFIITLKFFHDMRRRMRYVFTVGSLNEQEAALLYIRLRCYLNGVIEYDRTLVDKGRLSCYLEAQCVEARAAKLLADMLMREEMTPLRTIPIINSMCRDLRIRSQRGTVCPQDIADYLTEHTSLPALISAETAEKYAEVFGSPEISSHGENSVKQSA